MTSMCKLWAGPKFKDGYGRIGRKLAHRVLYAQVHGPIPAGLVIRHTCDQPACVNIDHLVLGTHADNVQDKCLRGRQARGAQANHSSLTEDSVRTIRASHESQTKLAKQFNVTQSMISRIKSNQFWKHVL